MKAIFDACFVTRSSYFNTACSFLPIVASDLYDDCFVFLEQYSHSYCSDEDCFCINLDGKINEDDVMDVLLSFEYLDRIYSHETQKDFADVKTLYYAKTHSDTIVCSCDYGLLFCCKMLNIPHECIKKTFISLCEKEGYHPSGDDLFNASWLYEPDGRERSFNFYYSKRCKECRDEPCDFSRYLPS